MPDKQKSKSVKVEDVNPQVKGVKIGLRTLRKIKIYPLAVADQLELTDMITEAVGMFFSIEAKKKTEDELPMEFVVFLLALIKENIGGVLTKVTGEDDSDAMLGDLSNTQMTEIIEIVYRENFEGPFERLVNLFQVKDEETMVESILEKLQPQSAGSTEPIDSTTSSKKASGKAD